MSSWAGKGRWREPSRWDGIVGGGRGEKESGEVCHDQFLPPRYVSRFVPTTYTSLDADPRHGFHGPFSIVDGSIGCLLFLPDFSTFPLHTSERSRAGSFLLSIGACSLGAQLRRHVATIWLVARRPSPVSVRVGEGAVLHTNDGICVYRYDVRCRVTCASRPPFFCVSFLSPFASNSLICPMYGVCERAREGEGKGTFHPVRIG